MDQLMGNFEALNEQRTQTLRQLREMISEYSALWSRNSAGLAAPDFLAHLETSRAHFLALWNQHVAIRKQMTDAGFLPSVRPEDLADISLNDSLRAKIEEQLQVELGAARSEYYGASQELRLLVQQGTGLPAPDGSLRAKQITDAHSAAQRKYTAAIRRLNAFLGDGPPTVE